MIQRDLWNNYGIAGDELGQRIAAATEAYDRTGRGRYIVFHGLEAVAVDELPSDQPMLCYADQQAYDARLFIYLAMPQIENKYDRIKALIQFADQHPDAPVKREALRLLEAIINEHMTVADTSRMLDVPHVIAEASMLYAKATIAESPKDRKAAKAALRQLVEHQQITDDAEWTSDVGVQIAAAFGVK